MTHVEPPSRGRRPAGTLLVAEAAGSLWPYPRALPLLPHEGLAGCTAHCGSWRSGQLCVAERRARAVGPGRRCAGGRPATELHLWPHASSPHAH